MATFRSLRTIALTALLALAACGDDAEADDAASAAGNGNGNANHGGSGAAQRDAGVSDASQPAAPVVCDVEPQRVCNEPKLTYADIEPIIERRCLSCHDGKGKEWPLLSYAHVASWYDQIRDSMLRCSMPPADAGVTMPTKEREQLLQWIKCGFAP